MGEAFTEDELDLLKHRVRDPDREGPPTCPHCQSTLERREVPPRGDVSYVRERVWLLCGGCGRSAVLDRPRRRGR